MTTRIDADGKPDAERWFTMGIHGDQEWWYAYTHAWLECRSGSKRA